MTSRELAIKFPDAEGRFVKVRGRSPRTFTNLPSASGNLIANFPLVMLLLIITNSRYSWADLSGGLDNIPFIGNTRDRESVGSEPKP